MAESEKSSLFEGSCACKRITYKCIAMPSGTQACNCVTCRKLSGGPHQVYADVEAKSIILFDNQDSLKYEGFPKDDFGGISYLRLSTVGERAYCVSCHTPLAMRYRPHPETIGLTLGSIDEETIANEKVKSSLHPSEHIFASQKCFWMDLAQDGITVHQRFSPQVDQRYPEVEKALRAS